MMREKPDEYLIRFSCLIVSHRSCDTDKLLGAGCPRGVRAAHPSRPKMCHVYKENSITREYNNRRILSCLQEKFNNPLIIMEND